MNNAASGVVSPDTFNATLATVAQLTTALNASAIYNASVATKAATLTVPFNSVYSYFDDVIVSAAERYDP